MEIKYIYAHGCPDCERMKKFLQKATSGRDITLKEFNSATKAAIDLAIEHGIDDLPSCIVGDKIFQGKYFEYEAIEEAVRNL